MISPDIRRPSERVGVALTLTIQAAGNFVRSVSQLSATLWCPLVKQDEVEEVLGQVGQPLVVGTVALELLDVGHHDIRGIDVAAVGFGTADLCWLWVLRTRQHLALAVEHAGLGRVEVAQQLRGDTSSWATTSTRRAFRANGASVMRPDLPQPTGRTMPASRWFSMSSKYSMIAA